MLYYAFIQPLGIKKCRTGKFQNKRDQLIYIYSNITCHMLTIFSIYFNKIENYVNYNH